MDIVYGLVPMGSSSTSDNSESIS